MTKILIIEDDPHTARLMKVTLSRQAYEVTIAQNGLVGLKIIREEPPNLVLLDLMLPGLDGFEILSQIRANPGTEELPVVIVSAKSLRSSRGGWVGSQRSSGGSTVIRMQAKRIAVRNGLVDAVTCPAKPTPRHYANRRRNR